MVRAVISFIGTPIRRLAALLAFVNLAVCILVGVSLETSYRQHQDRATLSSRNTNRLVAQSIAGDLERIDLALRAVSDEALRLGEVGLAPSPQTMDGFLTRLQGRLPMADSIRVATTQGDTVAGSGGVPAGITVRDRDYYQRLRDDPGAGLVMSSLVLGRISGKWVIIFARRIDLPGGGFGGVAYAPVTIDWFERKFAELEVGPHGTVVLRGDASRDFELLARIPHMDVVGQTRVSDTFRAQITAAPHGGTYEANAGADNVRRIFTYEAVSPYPLITLVGMATEDFVREWRREAVKMVTLTLVFLVVTVLSGTGMLRAWQALEQRTEELARSNADLEQFAYIASHDLQTPLRNIASYAQWLARRYQGRLDKDADEFIGFIVDGVRHMSAMIPDLLDYARVSTSPPQPVAVDLTEVVGHVLASFDETVKATGAEISVGRLPRVLAEPPPMESLFQNLIENALTYRDPTRPVRIAIDAEPIQGGQWRIRVSDTGIGIAPQYHEKIFVIFQRLDPIGFPGGTGIGLAMCRRIIRRFGGDIDVESQPGSGTTFSFTLPGA